MVLTNGQLVYWHNIRARNNNNNNNNNKLGKKNDKVTNNNIERTVRKYFTRKTNIMIPPKIQDPITDIDSSIEPSSSKYSTKYSSSSDQKINSELDFSLSSKNNVVLVKF